MKYLFTSVLAFLATAVLATDVVWQTDWPAPYHPDVPMEGTSHVVATSDGGAFAAHIDSHTLKGDTYYSTGVVKFSSTGTLQWYDYFSAAHGAVLGFDSFGNYYATIFPAALDHWSELQPITRKYAPNGTMLWEYSQGSGQGSIDMIVESDGTWYLAVYGFADPTRVQKIDASGTLLWEHESATNDLAITRDHSGDIAVLDGSTLKVLDENGNTLRTLSIPGWVLTKNRTAFGPQNEVYLAGSWLNVIRSYDALGNLRWQRTLPSYIATVNCDDNKVYVTTLNSAFWLDLNGNVLDEVPLPHYPSEFIPSSLDGLGNFWVTRGYIIYKLRQDPGISAAFSIYQPQYAFGRTSDSFTSELVGNYPNWKMRITRYRNGIDHDTAQLVRGRTTEHSHWAMMHSSDGYWSIAPGPVLTNQQTPISMIVKHTAPPENPTEMGVILESRGSAGGVKQSVAVYNFSSSTWTSLESNVVLPFGGSPDRYAILPIPSPLNHIGPSREIRLRVEYRNDSPVFSWPWTARVDREMIRYVK